MSADRQTVFDDILDLALARDTARRPTLVRVIVDGFVRDEDPRSLREVKQAEELLLHLLPQVDAFTRAVAAQKLAPRRDAPRSVIARLALDDIGVAEPILAESPLLDAGMIDAALARADDAARRAIARRRDLLPRHRDLLLASGDAETLAALRTPAEQVAPAIAATDEDRPMPAPAMLPPPDAGRRPPRAPAFLDAPVSLRRMLLARLSDAALDVHIPDPPTDAARALVRLAVLRQRESLAAMLGQFLDLPVGFARRVVEDAEGEPLVVATRYLEVPEDSFAQILVLVHPTLEQHTDRVLDLRQLHRATSRAAAATVVSNWRSEARETVTTHVPVAAPARPAPARASRPLFAAPPRKQGTDS